MISEKFTIGGLALGPSAHALTQSDTLLLNVEGG
jgi:hypothetical protein